MRFSAHSGRQDRACRCGHPRAAHEHLRAGTDCALGERGHCTHFHAVRSAGVLRSLRPRRTEVTVGAGATVVPIAARTASPVRHRHTA